MGVVYEVLCHDCRETQDLDKLQHWIVVTTIRDRSDALKLGEAVQKPALAFRAGLLLAFMLKHQGHHCTVVSDADPDLTIGDGYAEDPSKPWKIRQGDDVRDEDDDARAPRAGAGVMADPPDHFFINCARCRKRINVLETESFTTHVLEYLNDPEPCARIESLCNECEAKEPRPTEKAGAREYGAYWVSVRHFENRWSEPTVGMWCEDPGWSDKWYIVGTGADFDENEIRVLSPRLIPPNTQGAQRDPEP